MFQLTTCDWWSCLQSQLGTELSLKKVNVANIRLIQIPSKPKSPTNAAKQQNWFVSKSVMKRSSAPRQKSCIEWIRQILTFISSETSSTDDWVISLLVLLIPLAKPAFTGRAELALTRNRNSLAYFVLYIKVHVRSPWPSLSTDCRN